MRSQHPNFGQIIKTLRTKSAVNPALIFTAVCLAGGVPGAILATAPFNWVCAAIAVLGALTTALQIIFFTLFDRDRLQDEQHIENKLIINSVTPMVGDADNVIEIEAEQILSGNPQLEGQSDV